MAVTKKSIAAQAQREARADTSVPDVADRDLQAEAQAGYEEITGTAPEPTSYVYTGGQNAVVVVIGGTAYDFRKHEPVHLAHPDAGLDGHPDFARVEAEAEAEAEGEAS